MSDPVIHFDNVHLSLNSSAGTVDILRGIDLSVGEGEAVGLIGPSGSGKSTMLMVMAGLERASSGTVRVAGHDLGAMSEDQLAVFRRDHTGIVFQSFHLIATMTALENVAVPLELAGRRDAFARARGAGIGWACTPHRSLSRTAIGWRAAAGGAGARRCRQTAHLAGR